MEGRGRSYDATELRLGLAGTEPGDRSGLVVVARPNKRPLPDQWNKRREAKAQLVGWPPVRSYRRNCVNTPEAEDQSAIYVKVSMDGAPYLRKIDLKAYKKYKDLTQNLEDMFKWRFSPNDEHVITYEDRDGDWMMVGDVPWEMFISTCKRLRIMKGSEARGLNSSP